MINFKTRLVVTLGTVLLTSAPSAIAQNRGGGQGRGDSSGRGYNGGGNVNGGRNFNVGRNFGGRGYSNQSFGRSNFSGFKRGYIAPLGFYNGGGRGFYNAPRYLAPSRGFYGGGGFTAGRFYSGRGYFYGGSFWARPYFGVRFGIPFGYGYNTARGCGYVDGFGNFLRAPCYVTNSYNPY